MKRKEEEEEEASNLRKDKLKDVAEVFHSLAYLTRRESLSHWNSSSMRIQQ